MNVQSKIGSSHDESSDGTVAADGSLIIPPDKLAWFGNGDAFVGRRELRLLIEAEHDRPIGSSPIDKPHGVRIATMDDESAIVDLLLLDVAQNAKHVAVPNPDRILSLVRTATRRQTDKAISIISVIDGPERKPVALTIMEAQKWWWSEDFYFQELVCFVHPDHRRSRHVHDLLAFCQWWVDAWSQSRGQRTYLVCGVMGTRDVAAKTILYARKMKRVGAVFMHPCPWGDDPKRS